MLDKGLIDAGMALPKAAAEALEARLYSEYRTTAASLQFVASAKLFWDKE